jgi:UDP-glucose 4-epimerase
VGLAIGHADDGGDTLMNLLITGGTGFVMSNLARHWLESDFAGTVHVLDSAPWDGRLARFFEPARAHLDFMQASVLDQGAWDRLAAQPITHIVHGATITPSSGRERANPREIIEVNLMGTVNALEFARRLPELKRFIYVSSGAVYGEALPGPPDVPVPEDGHVSPVELYGITTLGSEHIARRYGAVFGLDVACVRFSGVYGPMDRATPARAVDRVPKKIVTAALAGKPIAVKALDGGGDFIHAYDVARALAAMLRARALEHGVYNVAYGEFTLMGELIDLVRQVVPGLRAEVVAASDADITYDPRDRLGR